MSSGKTESGNKEYPHHNFHTEMVDPDELEIDELNERTLNAGPRTDQGDLEKSIEKNGIETPPQVRPMENSEGYKVFAGQRRVLAAQAVGLPEIPVIVKDLDDMEALAASVNENNEHLKKEPARKDRAKAVEKLENEWGRKKVADYFGVTPQAIGNWLEPTRDFWSDTIFNPDENSEIDTEYIADDVLADLRRVMKKSHLAERAAKFIIKNNIPKQVVRDAIRSTDMPNNFLKELQKQWQSVSSGEKQIRPRITLTGKDAQRLKKWSRQQGLNEEQAARELVRRKLRAEFNNSDGGE